MSDVLLNLPLALLSPDPHQPRRELESDSPSVTEAATLQGLANSIRAVGILQPIRVHALASLDGASRYTIVSGQRRYEAAKMLGLDTVPCLVVARAQESLGSVHTAQAVVNGALSRCSVLPESLAEAAGCDVRTVTELSMEIVALDRMVEWNITPQSDPARASLAHEISTRPVRISARSH